MRGILLLVALCACGDLRAQCTITSVTFASYGTACNTVFGVPPALSGTWDPNACSVRLTLTGFTGCCNTFLQQRLLALGQQSANIPVPSVGPTCYLLVIPDLILTFPASQTTFDFVLPPGLPPSTIYAQGANVYFTTIGFTLDAELSNGLAVSVL
jgi:hypothetical protein